MNDYIKTFKLKRRSEINEFIWHFLDIDKLRRFFGPTIPVRLIDYISTFDLVNDNLINRFICDFCEQEPMDEIIRRARRIEMEDEMGLGVFREEHQRWLLKLQENKLKRQFDKRLN